MMRIKTISIIAVEMVQEGSSISKTNRLKMEKIDVFNKIMIWISVSNNIMILFKIFVNI
jgi:hypothetical protein